MAAHLKSNPAERKRWESAGVVDLVVLPLLPYLLWATFYYLKVWVYKVWLLLEALQLAASTFTLHHGRPPLPAGLRGELKKDSGTRLCYTVQLLDCVTEEPVWCRRPSCPAQAATACVHGRPRVRSRGRVSFV